MSQFPAFESALRKWARASAHQLAADLGSNLMVLRLNRWVYEAGEGYSLKGLSIWWDSNALNLLSTLPEWTEVLQAVERTPEVARHLGTLVGALGSASRWELPDVAHRLLPSPVPVGDDHVRMEPLSVFDQKYRRLEKVIASSTVEITRLWPLTNLELQQSELILEAGLRIRKVTPREYVAFLNSDFHGHPFGPMTTIPLDQAQMNALVWTSNVPKTIGNDESNSADIAALFQAEFELTEDFVATLGAQGIELFLGPLLELNEAFHPEGYTSRFGRDSSFHPAYFRFPRKLDRKTAAAFQNSWKVLRKFGRSKNSALHLAALRLHYAKTRPRAEDQILDVMIAAEALYLGSDGATERGELNYRLSQRAAFWADLKVVGMTKLQVFAVLKTAYGARSSIAHGAKPKASSLKIDGEQVNLDELIKRTTAIVRNGLQKALKAAAANPSGKFDVDWNQRIMGK